MYADIVASFALIVAFGGLYYTYINLTNLKSSNKYELLTKLNAITYKFNGLHTELQFIEDRITRVKTIDIVGNQLDDLQSKIVTQKQQVERVINQSKESYKDNQNRNPKIRYLHKMKHFADSANELHQHIKKDIKPLKLTYNDLLEKIHETALLKHKIKIID